MYINMPCVQGLQICTYCVCIYAYARVCMCAPSMYEYVHMFFLQQLCRPRYIYICILYKTYAYIQYVHMCIHMNIYTHIYIHIYIYTYMCTYTHIYICIYNIFIYLHMHIQICICTCCIYSFIQKKFLLRIARALARVRLRAREPR